MMTKVPGLLNSDKIYLASILELFLHLNSTYIKNICLKFIDYGLNMMYFAFFFYWRGINYVFREYHAKRSCRF